ncbi:hypothetical protein BH11MYX1_BH11MYX1_47980 [soil metagenome]
MSPARKLVLFVGLASALSWLAWAPLWLAAIRGLDTRPWPYWHLVGGMGPLLAAVLVNAYDRGARARLLTRTFGVRGRGRWILGAALGRSFSESRRSP